MWKEIRPFVALFSGTFLVMPPGPTTVSVHLFSLIHYGVDDQAASLALVMWIAFVFPVALLFGMMERRRAAARSQPTSSQERLP